VLVRLFLRSTAMVVSLAGTTCFFAKRRKALPVSKPFETGTTSAAN
jgi:hypothetical protein